jgi:hypothetical protein
MIEPKEIPSPEAIKPTTKYGVANKTMNPMVGNRFEIGIGFPPVHEECIHPPKISRTGDATKQTMAPRKPQKKPLIKQTAQKTERRAQESVIVFPTKTIAHLSIEESQS